MFGTYKKFAVAIFGAVVMAGYQFFDDSLITNLEWVQIAAAGVGAALVWITANGPIGTFWRYAKLVAFTLSAVLVTLYTTLPDGLNSNEIFTLVISALTALGILGAQTSLRQSWFGRCKTSTTSDLRTSLVFEAPCFSKDLTEYDMLINEALEAFSKDVNYAVGVSRVASRVAKRVKR